MLGLMQDWPLLIHKIIDFAALQHPRQEVVTRLVEGPIHRINYRDLRGARAESRPAARRATGSSSATASRRSPGTATAISKPGTASPGIGAIYHTVNPRLFPDQIAWIINHAEDRLRSSTSPSCRCWRRSPPKLPTIERYVVLTDAAHMPATKLKNAVAYEDWIGEVDGDFRWAGVRREHRRRALLHLRHHRPPQGRALFAPLQRAALADQRRPRLPAGRPRHAVMPVVPMFHANSWGLAFSARCAARKW